MFFFFNKYKKLFFCDFYVLTSQEEEGIRKTLSSSIRCLKTLKLASSLNSSTVKFNSLFQVLVAATLEDI